MPLAGHKDNHAGLLTNAQMETYRSSIGVKKGHEWDLYAGSEIAATEIRSYLNSIPYASKKAEKRTASSTPGQISKGGLSGTLSTQEAFGKILYGLAGDDSELSRRIVTTSPDVTVSTNLSGWVNRRGLFAREREEDTFKDKRIPSSQIWRKYPNGQHIELGIAKNNLFVLLGQLGLSSEMFDAPLVPVGTVYDPFISRGLDALNYALYQGAKFILAATPSGVTLGPEGGAHQSFYTPLIGIGQDRLSYFEPAYADELAVLMEHAIEEVQKPDGNAFYFRLSTRQIEQLPRQLSVQEEADIVSGAYWLKAPHLSTSVCLVYTGAIAPEVLSAVGDTAGMHPHVAVLSVTSPDKIYRDWSNSPGESHIDQLFAELPRDARCVTVHDGHPLTLSWLGSVQRNPVRPIGISTFGQCGNLHDLYRHFGMDKDSILDAVLPAGKARHSEAISSACDANV